MQAGQAVSQPTPVPIALDRRSSAPLAVQLADTLRAAAAEGYLRAGDRLPSTRELATQLGVSRTVTAAAYEQLHAEGWIVGRHGSGTYVTTTPPGASTGVSAGVAVDAVSHARAAGSVTAASQHRGRTRRPAQETIDLTLGASWVGGLDRAAWRRAWRAAADARPLLRPHRAGRPEAGDRIYVITTPEYVGLLDRLFAGRAAGVDEAQLYGDFALQADTRLSEIARAYPVELTPADAHLTAAEFLRRELSGDIEPGDRAPLGAVDIIVRRVSDTHEILEVGLALEHGRVPRPRIPLFHTPRELLDLVAKWRGRPVEKQSPEPARAAVEAEPVGAEVDRTAPDAD